MPTSGGKTREPAASQPFENETTAQYRQVINGVPGVNSDAGLIRATVDNDSTVTRLHSSVRKMAALEEKKRPATISLSRMGGWSRSACTK